jgi:hypothetical protein
MNQLSAITPRKKDKKWTAEQRKATFEVHHNAFRFCNLNFMLKYAKQMAKLLAGFQGLDSPLTQFLSCLRTFDGHGDR